MQWSSKAKELMRNQCIDFGMDLEQNIYKTFNEINRKRIQNGLDPLKRITKDIVEQTILNIIIDTPPGGDIQTKEKEHIALGKIYTGEKRRKKRNNIISKRRNTISYVNGRFLPPFQKSPIKVLSRLFLNILPISLFLVITKHSLFSLVKTLSLFPFEFG